MERTKNLRNEIENLYETLHTSTMIHNTSDAIFLVTNFRPVSPEIPSTDLILNLTG